MQSRLQPIGGNSRVVYNDFYKEDEFGVVYKITNTHNNKIYIGLTTQPIEKRMLAHRSDAFNSNKTTYDYYFYRSVRKYGWNSFTWEVIDKATTMTELNDKEIYWISYYNSTVDGYNLLSGGGGRNGVPHSEETVRKISGKNNHKSKPVVQIDKTTGFKIAKYETVRSAAEAIGIPKGQTGNISQACQGNRISAHGFYWMYEEDYDKKENFRFEPREMIRHRKSVLQFEKESGKLISKHSGVDAAAKKTNIPLASISKACNGKLKSAGGYKWAFAEGVA